MPINDSCVNDRSKLSTVLDLVLMVGVWIKDGMAIHDLSSLGAPMDPEGDGGNGQGGTDDGFFIEDNEMPLLDPDFWAEG